MRDRGDGDGLLQKILPEKGLEFGFDFKFNYSSSKGFYFEGQAGTELVVPVGLKIGSAFSLPEIQLGFKLTDKHGLGLFASLSGQTKLGPILLEIGRTGVQFDILPKESGKPEEIAKKMVEGALNKFLGEITLMGQPFIKDDKQTIEKMLAAKKAKVNGYAFLVVGEGIEKPQPTH